MIKILGYKDSDAALVQAIVSMAATLGLETIAEYVETQEIANILHGMKVDFAQGHGLHTPEPLEKLTCCSTIIAGSTSATTAAIPKLSSNAFPLSL
ncbi:MAG: EAL domain-containing protein [Oceanospirillaceae bacterium]|nr:EAL domain-containing protein [Oceanospirillaceae bacterium]